MKCFQCYSLLDDILFQNFSFLLEGPHEDGSGRVQWKNKIKILITLSCLNPNTVLSVWVTGVGIQRALILIMKMCVLIEL